MWGWGSGRRGFKQGSEGGSDEKSLGTRDLGAEWGWLEEAVGFGEGSAGGQGQEGGWGDGQVQTSAVLGLLCDFGSLSFLLRAHFPHLNSGGEEELASVCLGPRGPSSRGPLGPVIPVRAVLRQSCSAGSALPV